MRYNIIGYLIKEGFINTFKNKKSTFAALCIMIATMIIFGAFFAITTNIENMLAELERSQGIEVFIKLNTPQERVDEIGQQIRALDGVNTASFVSQADAINRMKDYFAGQESILAGVENIFPVSYIVTFTDLSKNYEIQDEIKTWDDIDTITNKNETTSTLLRIGNGIRVVSAVILIFLVVVSIFIISNTIKLTVHARRKEISIMKYVGATNAFIRWPFIVEGIVIGIVAALISLLIIGFAYNSIAQQLMATALFEKLNIVLVTFNDMLNLILIVYAILGIGIGVIGSMVSMKRYLEV